MPREKMSNFSALKLRTNKHRKSTFLEVFRLTLPEPFSFAYNLLQKHITCDIFMQIGALHVHTLLYQASFFNQRRVQKKWGDDVLPIKNCAPHSNVLKKTNDFATC